MLHNFIRDRKVIIYEERVDVWQVKSAVSTVEIVLLLDYFKIIS
jgi:hypothetical protein